MTRKVVYVQPYNQQGSTRCSLVAIFTIRCRVFICPHRMQNAEFNLLASSVLQNHSEGQKFIRGTDRGLLLCKETHKICKNALFLEFLAYLHFVA